MNRSIQGLDTLHTEEAVTASISMENLTSDSMDSLREVPAAGFLILVLILLFLLFIVREVMLVKVCTCPNKKNPCSEFFQNMLSFHAWTEQIYELRNM